MGSTTGSGRTYHFECGDGETWRSVVESVSFVTGRDPLAMTPLFDAVDPDGLDSVAKSGSGSVSFTWEGVDVTVYGSGEVVVEGGGEPASVREPLGSDSTLLLLTPAHSDVEDEACASLLFDGASEEHHVAGVTFGPSADDRVRAWSASGGSPANAAIVDVETEIRSFPQSAAKTSAEYQIDVSRIRDATDLAKVGQTVTERIAEWTDHDGQTVVCFHSLTALLMNVDEADAFRFLHILIEQLAAEDVIAHVHMDPIAHDERTIRTFRPLFDAVVEVDERGDWSIQTDTRIETG